MTNSSQYGFEETFKLTSDSTFEFESIGICTGHTSKGKGTYSKSRYTYRFYLNDSLKPKEPKISYLLDSLNKTPTTTFIYDFDTILFLNILDSSGTKVNYDYTIPRQLTEGTYLIRDIFTGENKITINNHPHSILIELFKQHRNEKFRKIRMKRKGNKYYYREDDNQYNFILTGGDSD
jgi:hypothetical protein